MTPASCSQTPLGLAFQAASSASPPANFDSRLASPDRPEPTSRAPISRMARRTSHSPISRALGWTTPPVLISRIVWACSRGANRVEITPTTMATAMARYEMFQPKRSASSSGTAPAMIIAPR